MTDSSFSTTSPIHIGKYKYVNIDALLASLEQNSANTNTSLTNQCTILSKLATALFDYSADLNVLSADEVPTALAELFTLTEFRQGLVSILSLFSQHLSDADATIFFLSSAPFDQRFSHLALALTVINKLIPITHFIFTSNQNPQSCAIQQIPTNQDIFDITQSLFSFLMINLFQPAWETHPPQNAKLLTCLDKCGFFSTFSTLITTPATTCHVSVLALGVLRTIFDHNQECIQVARNCTNIVQLMHQVFSHVMPHDIDIYDPMAAFSSKWAFSDSTVIFIGHIFRILEAFCGPCIDDNDGNLFKHITSTLPSTIQIATKLFTALYLNAVYETKWLHKKIALKALNNSCDRQDYGDYFIEPCTPNSDDHSQTNPASEISQNLEKLQEKSIFRFSHLIAPPFHGKHYACVGNHPISSTLSYIISHFSTLLELSVFILQTSPQTFTPKYQQLVHATQVFIAFLDVANIVQQQIPPLSPRVFIGQQKSPLHPACLLSDLLTTTRTQQWLDIQSNMFSFIASHPTLNNPHFQPSIAAHQMIMPPSYDDRAFSERHHLLRSTFPKYITKLFVESDIPRRMHLLSRTMLPILLSHIVLEIYMTSMCAWQFAGLHDTDVAPFYSQQHPTIQGIMDYNCIPHAGLLSSQDPTHFKQLSDSVKLIDPTTNYEHGIHPQFYQSSRITRSNSIINLLLLVMAADEHGGEIPQPRNGIPHAADLRMWAYTIKYNFARVVAYSASLTPIYDEMNVFSPYMYVNPDDEEDLPKPNSTNCKNKFSSVFFVANSDKIARHIISPICYLQSLFNVISHGERAQPISSQFPQLKADDIRKKEYRYLQLCPEPLRAPMIAIYIDAIITIIQGLCFSNAERVSKHNKAQMSKVITDAVLSQRGVTNDDEKQSAHMIGDELALIPDHFHNIRVEESFILSCLSPNDQGHPPLLDRLHQTHAVQYVYQSSLDDEQNSRRSGDQPVTFDVYGLLTEFAIHYLIDLLLNEVPRDIIMNDSKYRNKSTQSRIENPPYLDFSFIPSQHPSKLLDLLDPTTSDGNSPSSMISTNTSSSTTSTNQQFHNTTIIPFSMYQQFHLTLPADLHDIDEQVMNISQLQLTNKSSQFPHDIIYPATIYGDFCMDDTNNRPLEPIPTLFTSHPLTHHFDFVLSLPNADLKALYNSIDLNKLFDFLNVIQGHTAKSVPHLPTAVVHNQSKEEDEEKGTSKRKVTENTVKKNVKRTRPNKNHDDDVADIDVVETSASNLNALVQIDQLPTQLLPFVRASYTLTPQPQSSSLTASVFSHGKVNITQLLSQCKTIKSPWLYPTDFDNSFRTFAHSMIPNILKFPTDVVHIQASVSDILRSVEADNEEGGERNNRVVFIFIAGGLRDLITDSESDDDDNDADRDDEF